MNSIKSILINWYISIILIASIFLSSCQSKSNIHPSTQKMIDYLEMKRDSAKESTAFPYFTDKMLSSLSVSIKGLSPKMAGSKTLDYALVLILNGQNIKAKELIESFLQAIPRGDQVDRFTAKYYRVLALAYIREAEQSNCINNHSAESCIVPLKGGGIHTDQEPAEKAIEVYEKLLEFNKEDYQSRWFYNVAHMAIGAYPDGVDSRYLLESDHLTSNFNFPTFENVAMSTGVAANNHAGGVSIFDFNNDGLEDIFTSSYGLEDQSILYINQGDGTFEDWTEKAGIKGLVGGLNCVHGDFNNDGYIDIFIARGAWLSNNGHIANSLLINDGGNRFIDNTQEAGLLSFHPTGGLATADIDLDGDLDLFVGNESSRDVNTSQLFINDGTGKFENKAKDYGLDIEEFVKGAVWDDINNDLLPDLYISCYASKNLLFINRGMDSSGNIRFEESAISAGVSEPVYSFTTWFWDYNQDGFQDLFVCGYDNREPHFISDEIVKEMLNEPTKGEHPRLFRNNGDESFTDVTDTVGLNRLIYAMGANFGDLDSDGFPDFYAGTGEFNIWATIPNRMFQNLGGTSFREVTTEGGFGQIQKGHGVAFGDLDNDGDQDIYHQVGGAVESDVFHNMLFENPGFDNHWIKLILHGTKSNRSAIGARIKVYCSLGPDPKQAENKKSSYVRYATINTGGSFGANSLSQSIGLGQAEQIDSMCVTWPHEEQKTQWFYELKIDQAYELTESDSLLLMDDHPSFLFSRAHVHH